MMIKIQLFIGKYSNKIKVKLREIFSRLQTHISILEQQQNSNGYFSYEETPSLNDQVQEKKNISSKFQYLYLIFAFSIQLFHIQKKIQMLLKNSFSKNLNQYKTLIYFFFLRKREYELDQLREKLNGFQYESDEKLQRTIEQYNNLEKRYSLVESERNNLRQELQNLQNENDLIKTYMNRLPSEIEYEKLKQSYQILQDQYKQSNQTIVEYRKEKNHLKKQILIYEQQQQQSIKKSSDLSEEKILLNAKCLTVDERNERDKKYEEFNQIIQQLNEKLNEENISLKQYQNLNENNIKTVQSLTNDLKKKEQFIKDLTNQLRQVNFSRVLTFESRSKNKIIDLL